MVKFGLSGAFLGQVKKILWGENALGLGVLLLDGYKILSACLPGGSLNG